MKITIGILELIDLQSALRRASRYTEDALEYSERENLTKSVEVYQRDLENYQALHQKLEAAFDEAYPPAKDTAA